MHIEPILTGSFLEFCYLAWNDTRQALVFDPGDDAELIEQVLKRNDLEVAAYICTHGHTDHISALAALHDDYPAPIAMHSADWVWAFEEQNQLAPYYAVPRLPLQFDFIAMEKQKEWECAGMQLRCIETPGHTPGSCCLLFPEFDVLIAGDTLFKGSCGRTDLPGGDARKLKESLHKLKQLPDNTRVYPGHGSDTTIGVERRNNYYMQ
jgi:glyoxylase-like metal-dependent hydrolase (beta-lactamase superfamily II)